MLEVISEELLQYQQNKLADYQLKNKKVADGGVVIAGDSIIEFYPIKKYFGQDFPLTNRGIAGTDSQWLLDHVDTQVNDLNPEHVILLIGCNDIGLGFDKAHILSNIVDIIGQIRSHSIYCQISLLSLVPVSKNPIYQKTVKARTNQAIDEINQDLAMIPAINFIDINSILKNEQGGLADEYTLDGMHLNFLAYSKISEIIKTYL
ncbi:SGNH/GDSL hydrolase family protein [Streptococcus ictaluri]|uniref:GDSL-like protein n=1 Tax=Streptococcus ictaluri 707-05 TaxID=764299 RepID=G5K3F9_9STRE|nr:SGNH/GDSL hydrolase family protein [Streptococcus ictaluri]EHI69835.1 GDSL-like protein [Streptococcus ictaluri 707-05]